MPYINQHLVGKFFDEEYTGRKPFFWEYITNADYVREYNARLSAIASELNHHKDANDLIPYIQEHFGFSRKEALRFSQANTNYNWRTGTIEDRRAMLLEANRGFSRISQSYPLDEIINSEEDDSR